MTQQPLGTRRTHVQENPYVKDEKKFSFFLHIKK